MKLELSLQLQQIPPELSEGYEVEEETAAVTGQGIDRFTSSISRFVDRYREPRCVYCYRTEGDHSHIGANCLGGPGQLFANRTFTVMQLCEAETGESYRGACDSLPCHRYGVVTELSTGQLLCLHDFMERQ
jgi:hypothetical protein